ncbi:hypothetical protein Bca52824_012691 [Brassica carinata]|uniref:Uncharacterized protein n=1 Tax=Brassica carinata TaxID=52824 RepID=A0A8X8B2M1_BRACI|nr:hypothetical protein Bca52824_012691 [Brassica carinata]
MALQHVCDNQLQAKTLCSSEVMTMINWEDLVCPICLDSPHNGVLLQCSSHDNGCRAFVCNTDHLHSNCLDRFITACGTTTDPPPSEPPRSKRRSYWMASCGRSTCHSRRETTLLRGRTVQVHGYLHGAPASTQSEHPDSRPSKIDPARKLDWENFQQSSEIIDVLSTIHSEVPRGVVLGDYVIEYGDDDDDTGDEFEDVRTRNRRRARVSESRRGGSRRSSYDNSNSDDSSVASVEFPEYRVDEIDDEFITTTASGVNRSSSVHQSQLGIEVRQVKQTSVFVANVAFLYKT